MKFKVIDFNDRHDCHHDCRDENGYLVKIDLMIDRSFPDMDPRNLIGKTVEVDSLSSYMYIGFGVRIVEEA